MTVHPFKNCLFSHKNLAILPLGDIDLNFLKPKPAGTNPVSAQAPKGKPVLGNSLALLVAVAWAFLTTVEVVEAVEAAAQQGIGVGVAGIAAITYGSELHLSDWPWASVI